MLPRDSRIHRFFLAFFPDRVYNHMCPFTEGVWTSVKQSTCAKVVHVYNARVNDERYRPPFETEMRPDIRVEAAESEHLNFLREVYRIIRKRLWIILLAAVVWGGGGGLHPCADAHLRSLHQDVDPEAE
jgi:hypothetical protein